MSRFGTKLNVNPNLWDVNTSAVLGRTKEAAEINTFLDTIKTSIYRQFLKVFSKNTRKCKQIRLHFVSLPKR